MCQNAFKLKWNTKPYRSRIRGENLMGHQDCRILNKYRRVEKIENDSVLLELEPVKSKYLEQEN